jgi:hypothetical protein
LKETSNSSNVRSRNTAKRARGIQHWSQRLRAYCGSLQRPTSLRGTDKEIRVYLSGLASAHAPRRDPLLNFVAALKPNTTCSIFGYSRRSRQGRYFWAARRKLAPSSAVAVRCVLKDIWGAVRAVNSFVRRLWFRPAILGHNARPGSSGHSTPSLAPSSPTASRKIHSYCTPCCRH